MFAIEMYAPCANYGIGKWRTKSRAYALRVARKLNQSEREGGFLMWHRVVEVPDAESEAGKRGAE